MDRNTRIDNPDDEVLPASPSRRRNSMMIGCLFAIAVIAILIWFAATHSGTGEQPTWFGT